jgi:hypothetical protein
VATIGIGQARRKSALQRYYHLIEDLHLGRRPRRRGGRCRNHSPPGSQVVEILSHLSNLRRRAIGFSEHGSAPIGPFAYQDRKSCPNIFTMFPQYFHNSQQSAPPSLHLRPRVTPAT